MIIFTNKQLNIIMNAVLTDENAADDCNEIVDIIKSYLIQQLERTADDPMGIGK
jgi:hypothetical protein